MPIYEYDCPACGRFEVILLPGEKEVKECPECTKKGKKVKVSKAVSPAAFHLKGSGWYKTDYANGSSKKPVTATKSDSGGGGTEAPNKPADSKPEQSKSTAAKGSGSCGSNCGCH